MLLSWGTGFSRGAAAGGGCCSFPPACLCDVLLLDVLQLASLVWKVHAAIGSLCSAERAEFRSRSQRARLGDLPGKPVSLQVAWELPRTSFLADPRVSSCQTCKGYRKTQQAAAKSGICAVQVKWANTSGGFRCAPSTAAPASLTATASASPEAASAPFSFSDHECVPGATSSKPGGGASASENNKGWC